MNISGGTVSASVVSVCAMREGVVDAAIFKCTIDQAMIEDRRRREMREIRYVAWFILFLSLLYYRTV